MKKSLLFKLLFLSAILVLSFSLAACGGGEEEVVAEDPVAEEPVVEEPVVEEPAPAPVETEIYGYWYLEVDPTFIMDVTRENQVLIYDYEEGYILANYSLVWDEATNSGQMVAGELALDISLDGTIVNFEALDGSMAELIPLDSAYAQATIIPYDPNSNPVLDPDFDPNNYTYEELYGYGGYYSVDPYNSYYGDYYSYGSYNESGYSYNSYNESGYYYNSYNESGYYYNSYDESGY